MEDWLTGIAVAVVAIAVQAWTWRRAFRLPGDGDD
jgi:hypothetical protein